MNYYSICVVNSIKGKHSEFLVKFDSIQDYTLVKNSTESLNIFVNEGTKEGKFIKSNEYFQLTEFLLPLAIVSYQEKRCVQVTLNEKHKIVSLEIM